MITYYPSSIIGTRGVSGQCKCTFASFHFGCLKGMMRITVSISHKKINKHPCNLHAKPPTSNKRQRKKKGKKAQARAWPTMALARANQSGYCGARQSCPPPPQCPRPPLHNIMTVSVSCYTNQTLSTQQLSPPYPSA